MIVNENIVNYINYSNEMYLTYMGNPPLYFLRKLRKGSPRCPHCWDDIRKQARDNNCNYCFETGFEGGYEQPISVLVCYESVPSPTQTTISPSDVNDETDEQIPIWMTNSPVVSPGDLFINEDGDRFISIKHQGTTREYKDNLRQIVLMQKLPPTHASYQIVLSEDKTKIILPEENVGGD